MNAPAAPKNLPFEDLDRTLVLLLSEYRLQGEYSPAAQSLFRDFLPALTKTLGYEFPKVSPEETLSFAWEMTRRVGLEMADSPCAYLMNCVRDCLRRKMVAERHGVSENTIRSSKWKKLTQEIGLQDDEILIHPVGDDDTTVLNSVTTPATRQSSPLWKELSILLTHLGWPQKVAVESVEILEYSAESRRFDPEKTLCELPTEVPSSRRQALITFVTSPRGYVWARLRGISPALAINLPSVQIHLSSLAFTAS